MRNKCKKKMLSCAKRYQKRKFTSTSVNSKFTR